MACIRLQRQQSKPIPRGLQRAYCGRSSLVPQCGQRSGKGSQGPTYEQLYAEAKRRNVDGRSHMNKAELQRALGGS